MILIMILYHSTSENRRIQRVLKSKVQGEFSFDQLDNQQNNQLDREFLKINGQMEIPGTLKILSTLLSNR